MRIYTKQEKKEYWWARCPSCGWKVLTCDCNGFGPLGETGDYDDGYCPRCDCVIDEAYYFKVTFKQRMEWIIKLLKRGKK